MEPTSRFTPRRGFLGSIAAGAAALVATRWSNAEAEVFSTLGPPTVGDEWLARITGKHKQVFDCVTPNEGFGAVFPLTYIDTTKDAMKVTDKDISAVAV